MARKKAETTPAEASANPLANILATIPTAEQADAALQATKAAYAAERENVLNDLIAVSMEKLAKAFKEFTANPKEYWPLEFFIIFTEAAYDKWNIQTGDFQTLQAFLTEKGFQSTFSRDQTGVEARQNGIKMLSYTLKISPAKKEEETPS